MITVLWFVLRFVDFGVAFSISVGLGVDCWLVWIFICFGVWMGLLWGGCGAIRWFPVNSVVYSYWFVVFVLPVLDCYVLLVYVGFVTLLRLFVWVVVGDLFSVCVFWVGCVGCWLCSVLIVLISMCYRWCLCVCYL